MLLMGISTNIYSIKLKWSGESPKNYNNSTKLGRVNIPGHMMGLLPIAVLINRIIVTYINSGSLINGLFQNMVIKIFS